MITTKIPERSAAQCVERCRRKQATWSALPISQRLVLVRKFRNLLADECDMLCAALEQDINKPAEETIAGDILPLAAACRFLEQRARGILRPQKIPVVSRPLWLFGQRDVVHRRARGVVGIIGTWNYPLYLNGVQIMQAVVAGNAVLWKPSEVAPSSARGLYSLLQRAGFPDGLVEMLPATREAGQELANAAIDHVVFTGSSTTGRALAANLGRRLVSSTLELSGCDSMFVLKDADVDLAAQAAWFGATLNKGQTCLATRRVFVDRGCAPAFVEAINQYAAKAQPMLLALEGQVRQAERLVSEAAADGARVLRGSSQASTENANLACQPTVIAEARPEMAICQEAIFAPVVAVMPFDSETDALKMDARCPYGLGASIFSTDVRRATDFAAHLRTGSVAINDVIVPTAHPETPFGGVGESGWGVTQGVEGLLDMTVPQTVSIRSGTSRPHYGAACGTPAFTSQMLRGLLQWSHGATFFRRLNGLRQLIRGWRRKM